MPVDRSFQPGWGSAIGYFFCAALACWGVLVWAIR